MNEWLKKRIKGWIGEWSEFTGYLKIWQFIV